MPIIDDAQSYVVDKFHGARTAPDPVSVSPGFALDSPNMEFFVDQARTRRSFEPVEFLGNQLTNAANVTSLEFFDAVGTSWLVYLTTNGVNSSSVHGIRTASGTDDAITDIITTTPPNPPSPMWFATYAQLGKYLISCMNVQEFFAGALQARVTDLSDSAPYNEIAFQPPLLDTLVTVSASEPSGGIVDAGTHLIAAIFQTRTGRWTNPGPTTSADLFSPTVFVATGGRNLQVTFTPTTVWPATYSALQLIMSPVLNNADYRLVSNTITPIPYGTSTPVTVTIDYSDLNLDTMPSVQDAGYFDLLSMTHAGAGPFTPGFVLQWKSRTVYATIYGGVPCLFVSEQNQQQWLIASEYILILPNGEAPSGAFVYQDKLIVTTLLGKSYAYVDNGQLPINFSPPTDIDGRIGAITPRMVTRQSTYMASAWIACPAGLYTFNGYAFQNIPLDWYAKNEWDEIDWTIYAGSGATKCIEIDSTNKVLYVLARRVTDPACSVYTFNFIDGLSPEVINYSRHTYPAGYGSPGGLLWLPIPPGTTYYGSGGGSFLPQRMQELWMCATGADPANTNLVRFKSLQANDPSPWSGDLYSNDLMGVVSSYQLALLPPDSDFVLQHVGDRIRMTGSGYVDILISSTDGSVAVVPILSPLNLSLSPDRRDLFTYELLAEQATVRFTTDGQPGSYFILSFLKHYYTDYSIVY